MPFSLLEACALKNAVECTRRDVYAKFSCNRDRSYLFRVLKLPMASSRANVVPAVLLQQSYHFAHLHVPTLALAPTPATREGSAIR